MSEIESGEGGIKAMAFKNIVLLTFQMFCQELQQQNDFLHHQLQAARVEIIALRGGKIPSGPVEFKPVPLSQNKGFEEQLKVGHTED